MTKLLVELQKMMNNAKTTISKFQKSAVIQSDMIKKIEGFLFANIIDNFFNNLTKENAKELKINHDNIKKLRHRFRSLLHSNQKILTHSHILDYTNYITFKRNLKKVDKNSYKLLIMLEKEIDFKVCLKHLKEFKKEAKKLGRNDKNMDNVLITVLTEHTIKAKKPIPSKK